MKYFILLLFILSIINGFIWIGKENKEESFKDSVYKKNVEWCTKHPKWCKHK